MQKVAPAEPIICATTGAQFHIPRALRDREGDRAGFFISHPVRRDRPSLRASCVTMISAALTAVGGAIFGQYLMYLNPETVSGIAVSLQIVFAGIVGGMYAMLGPTVGALLTISLNEGLRVAFATNFVGAANTIYGILLILCIIFMPRGILGVVESISARSAQLKRKQLAI
jgi:hypothetical protein